MDEAGFWDVIEDAYAALECGYYDEESPADAVALAWTAGLAGLPPEEIVDFGVHLERMLERAWRPAVWAAAWLLAGGTDDDRHAFIDDGDRFTDFRAALVALGRTSFETVLADPDALAGLPDLAAVDSGDWSLFMRLPTVPADAWAQTGGDRDAFARAVAERLGARPRRGNPPPDGPWQSAVDGLPEGLPRLAERFPDGAV
ncbi:DUF4240 domain-containing protein [Catellatospora sp. NPDC049609]|uniref:DUF4240 domain-containing protein n=1 Tax=Catellatospora sp. NPDC049609 TaxID=3155505 RepID=UPI0034129DA8